MNQEIINELTGKLTPELMTLINNVFIVLDEQVELESNLLHYINNQELIDLTMEEKVIACINNNLVNELKDLGITLSNNYEFRQIANLYLAINEINNFNDKELIEDIFNTDSNNVEMLLEMLTLIDPKGSYLYLEIIDSVDKFLVDNIKESLIVKTSYETEINESDENLQNNIIHDTKIENIKAFIDYLKTSTFIYDELLHGLGINYSFNTYVESFSGKLQELIDNEDLITLADALFSIYLICEEADTDLFSLISKFNIDFNLHFNQSIIVNNRLKKHLGSMIDE